jgi:hypothetical protein
VQKGYFGRQRLEALTKGLRTQLLVGAPGRPPVAHKAYREIDLAHAKRDMQAYMTPATLQPKPIMLKRYSSGSRTNRSAGNSQILSSKVLAVLDTSERTWIHHFVRQDVCRTPFSTALSMRAEMNRILSLPDFAGLAQKEDCTSSSSRSMTSKRREMSISYDSHEIHKVKVLHSFWSPEPFLSTRPSAEASIFKQF